MGQSLQINGACDYDISRAVEDDVTVPIYYESRLARIELEEDEKPKIDAEIAELTEDKAESEQQRLPAQMGEPRGAGGLRETPRPGRRRPREAALDGKAMIVCMRRRICRGSRQ
jgi:type I restriction enzyme, R subunit